jgi:hypothetical protein
MLTSNLQIWQYCTLTEVFHTKSEALTHQKKPLETTGPRTGTQSPQISSAGNFFGTKSLGLSSMIYQFFAVKNWSPFGRSLFNFPHNMMKS